MTIIWKGETKSFGGFFYLFLWSTEVKWNKCYWAILFALGDRSRGEHWSGSDDHTACSCLFFFEKNGRDSKAAGLWQKRHYKQTQSMGQLSYCVNILTHKKLKYIHRKCKMLSPPPFFFLLLDDLLASFDLKLSHMKATGHWFHSLMLWSFLSFPC